MRPIEIVATIIASIFLLIAFVIVARIALWIPLRLLSSISGWNTLASRFPAKEIDTASTVYRFCSVRLGWVDYKSCVSVYLSQNFVSLRIGLPFRDYHPGISIPRSMLKPTTKSTFWLTEFTIDGENTSIWFNKQLAKRLCKFEVSDGLAMLDFFDLNLSKTDDGLAIAMNL